MKRERGWRAQGDGPFDEVVMDGDIHVEKLDVRSWFASLGCQTAGHVKLWFAFRPDGTICWCNAEITDCAGKSREVTLVNEPKRRARRLSERGEGR